jgi:hypothetical protein
MTRFLLALLAGTILVALASSAGMAGKRDSGFIGHTGRVEPHARYQNDIAYEFGTVSQRGAKKTPYVERCYWTAKPGTFFLSGLTQVCMRYTLENTE